MENEYLQQEPKQTVSMQSLFGGLPEMKKVRELGSRQKLIARVCSELGIGKNYVSGVFWQTKDIFTDQEILDLKDAALKWNTVPLEVRARWFRKMVKQKRVEIKATLK